MEATQFSANSNVLVFKPHVLAGIDELAVEMRRRIERTDYARFATRQRTTGIPIPFEVVYGKNQIEFAADALRRLKHLPHNFRADHFWPA